MATMEERLGHLLRRAADRKSQELGKEYTSYKLAQDSKTTQSYAYRALHGKIIPVLEILMNWCEALGCTPEEREHIFHAAGYLSPEEVQAMLDQPAA